MQHPFGGLINGDSNRSKSMESTPLKSDTTRRAAMGYVAGSLVAGSMMLKFAHAKDEQQFQENPEAGARSDHGRHVVVPRDFRSLKEKRRKELGIHGEFFQSSRNGRSGYLAWITPERAKAIAQETDVAGVFTIEPEDLPDLDSAYSGSPQLIVTLVPNSWKKRPDSNTFLSDTEVYGEWKQRHETVQSIKLKKGLKPGTFVFKLTRRVVPEKLLKALKSHPQVVSISWLDKKEAKPPIGGPVPTTLALGEEGATTLAIGEEGGRPVPPLRPTTKAVGEEGAATTLAIGEEGGKPKQRRQLKR